MISIKNLLDIIATEALESSYVSRDTLDYSKPKKENLQNPNSLPPIRYTLELIEKPDGSLEWVE